MIKMAVTNFIQTIWSRKIQKDIEMKTKLIDFCTREYEGDVKFAGAVKILGVGEVRTTGYTGRVDYEPMNDLGQLLPIDFREYFAFNVDDVNKAQSVPGLPEKFQNKASSRLAQRRDINIGRLVAGKCISTVAEQTATYTITSDTAVLSYKDYFVQKTDAAGNTFYERVAKPVAANLSSYYEITSGTYKPGATNITTAAAKTQAGVKAGFDDGFVALNLRNVDFGIRMEIDPETYMTFKNNLTELSTNNPELIRKGHVGMYNNAEVVMSNAIYNDASYKYCILRTKDAIAFAGQINEVEALRLENTFGDGIRGLDVYGMSIISQDELEVVKIPA